jgi:multiple sugar transport system substrate-binding protein
MKKLILAALVLASMAVAVSSQSIKVLLWDDPLAKIIQANIPDFEKATGYKVEVEMVAPPQVLTKTSVGVTATSSDYDVVPLDEGNIPVFASLMSTWDSLPDGKVFKKTPKDSVTPAMLDVGTWDGKLIAFPINGNIYVWFTKKDLIDNPQYKKDFKAKYGYELVVPVTFKQLDDEVSFFSALGVGGFGPFNGGAAGVHAEAIYMWESFGTSFINWVNGKPKVVLDETKAVTGMEFYKRLMTMSPKGSETWAHNERIASFTTDPKGAWTQFHWPSYIASYENPDTSLVSGKVYYSAPPGGPSKRVAVRGAWAVGIPVAAKNKAGGAEFAYWWTSKAMAQKVVEGNAIPARADVRTEPQYAKKMPWLAAIADSMKYAVARPRFKEVAQVQDIVKKYWVQGITGQLPTADAVKAIVKETNDVLSKAGY